MVDPRKPSKLIDFQKSKITAKPPRQKKNHLTMINYENFNEKSYKITLNQSRRFENRFFISSQKFQKFFNVEFHENRV